MLFKYWSVSSSCCDYYCTRAISMLFIGYSKCGIALMRSDQKLHNDILNLRKWTSGKRSRLISPISPFILNVRSSSRLPDFPRRPSSSFSI